jgi:peptidoglycan/xylan/chitin deacetylase (PgdA/CDA1 family)
MHKLLAPIGFLSGATARRWRSDAYRGCGIALVYHRIATRGGAGEPAGFGVERGLPVDVFEKQMRFLLAHFRPAPTLELLTPEPGAQPLRFSVTFDDGYRDNLTLAAPVLSRLGIPATLFVTTDFVGSDRLYWWEELGELLRATAEPVLEIGSVEPALGSRWELPGRLGLASRRARERAHWLVSMALMQTPPADIPAILARIALALRVPRREQGRRVPLVDWDDVRRWQAAGFEVGAHGATHANLGLAPPDEAQREVHDSLAAVERETGAPATLFAYPYGGPEHRTPAVEQALAARGCRGAFTTDLGLVGPGSHPLRLARVGLGSGSRLKCTHHLDQAFVSEPTREAIAATTG